MKRNIVSRIMLILLLIGMLTLALNIQPVKSEPTTWTVDDDGPADFSSIQEAINSPDVKDGDTIFVHIGIYVENVVINKTLSLVGENRSTTIVDGNGTGIGFYVAVDDVTITRFTIRNAYWVGIHIDHARNTTISDNILLENYDGIYLGLSNNNIIKGNIVTNTLHLSIYLYESRNNTIIGNTISNAQKGFYMPSASGNIIYHNNLINNEDQAMSEVNVWDNGYPSGGNYWSDYNGTDFYSGPNQDIPGSDGIGDTPYIIDGNETDRYPLIRSHGYVPKPDVNDDGIVNIKDIIICALAYGSKPGYSNWNLQADIYPDGRIDIFDLVTIAVNFGKTW